VDGGEWLDFVSADLKHLTPRPERHVRNGDARRVQAEEASEAETPQPDAEIFVHPAVEPAQKEFPEPAIAAAPAAEPEPASALAAEASTYEPDQERRDKFFSRLSRWSKKS
jgi:hypothetical protein